MARCTSSVASRPSSRIVFGPRSTNSRIREDRGAADGDRRRRVVPCREDVAGSPADSAPSALSVSMSTAVSLDGHVQRAGNLRAAGWQRILADGHQHGYLTLGEGDLLETPSPAGAARRARCSAHSGTRVFCLRSSRGQSAPAAPAVKTTHRGLGPLGAWAWPPSPGLEASVIWGVGVPDLLQQDPGSNGDRRFTGGRARQESSQQS